MSKIQIDRLTFAYEGSYDNVFEDVSFQLDSNWKLGLIGRNGCGKTTLLRLFRGELTYQGTIDASVDFTYFPYRVQDPSQTAGEIAEMLAEEGESWRIYRELGLLEVPESVLDRPFTTLSGGEQTKLLLAALFAGENRFLLIDEPTNHLDLAGRESVARYLQKKRSFILVSHDREFLDGCIDHVMHIGNTRITVQKGNFSTWQREKQAQDQLELERSEQLKKDIRRLEAAARRTANWSEQVEKSKRSTGKVGSGRDAPVLDKGYVGHQSAKMMQRAKSIAQRQDRAIQEKQELLKEVETAEELKIHPLKPESRSLLRLEGVTVAYDPACPVCRDVGFSLSAGERVAIQGKNGSGKSSLLKLICGEEIPHTGTVWRWGGLKISYVGQDTAGLGGDLHSYAQAHEIEKSLFFAILRKMGFPRVQFEKQISDFSAGQKKKVLLAGSLSQQAHLYIWDEPLNYIDLMSRLQIEDLLVDSGASMLFVEHDRAFCHRVATRIVAL